MGIIKEYKCKEMRQILSERMECEQREGLLNYRISKTSKSLRKEDVNKIFGWAIYNLRLEKKNERDAIHVLDFTDWYSQKCMHNM